MIERVISGGQTGADQGGLDGAMLHWGGWVSERMGGWCPAGRRAEDGPIPNRYQLQETVEWAYSPRTELNVKEADGTVIFTHGDPTGGSKLTLDIAYRECRQAIHVDIGTMEPDQAAELVVDWVDAYGVRVLNVAGSRESSCPGIQGYVTETIRRVLKEIGDPPC